MPDPVQFKYTTDVQIAQFMGESSPSSWLLADIGNWAPIVEYVAELACRTDFVDRTGTTLLMDGSGSCLLTLPYFLRTLTQVEILDDLGQPLQDVTVYCQPYPNNPQIGVYRWLERTIFHDITSRGFQQPFLRGSQNVKIVGDFGWVAGSLPAPIPAAIAFGVQHFMNYRKVDEFIKTQSGVGRLIEYSDTDAWIRLPKMSKALLAPFTLSRLLG